MVLLPNDQLGTTKFMSRPFGCMYKITVIFQNCHPPPPHPSYGSASVSLSQLNGFMLPFVGIGAIMMLLIPLHFCLLPPGSESKSTTVAHASHLKKKKFTLRWIVQ